MNVFTGSKVTDGDSRQQQQQQQRNSIFGKIVVVSMAFVLINTIAIIGLAAVAARVVLGGSLVGGVAGSDESVVAATTATAKVTGTTTTSHVIEVSLNPYMKQHGMSDAAKIFLQRNLHGNVESTGDDEGIGLMRGLDGSQEVIGTAPRQQVLDAFLDVIASHGKQDVSSGGISVTAQVGGTTWSRKINTDDMSIQQQKQNASHGGKYTTFSGLHIEDRLDLNFQVHCPMDVGARYCEIVTEGPFSFGDFVMKIIEGRDNRQEILHQSVGGMLKEQIHQDDDPIKNRRLQSCSRNSDCGTDQYCDMTYLDSTGNCRLSGGRCFSEHSLVRVQGRGKVLMRDIKVGDKALTSNSNSNNKNNNDQSGVYYRTVVVTQTHHEGEGPYEFLQIYTTDTENEEQDRPLEITHDHLIFVEGFSAPIPAQDIKVGNFLFTIEGRKMVTRIKTVTHTTAYNIITTDGTILVNDILASGFTTFNKKSHIQFMGYDVVSIHDMIRILGSWYHALCYVSQSEGICAQSYNGTTHTQHVDEPSILEKFAINSKLALDATDKLDVLAPTLLCMCLMVVMPFLMLVVGISGCLYSCLSSPLMPCVYEFSLLDKSSHCCTILHNAIHPQIKAKYQ